MNIPVTVMDFAYIFSQVNITATSMFVQSCDKFLSYPYTYRHIYTLLLTRTSRYSIHLKINWEKRWCRYSNEYMCIADFSAFPSSRSGLDNSSPDRDSIRTYILRLVVINGNLHLSIICFQLLRSKNIIIIIYLSYM